MLHQSIFEKYKRDCIEKNITIPKAKTKMYGFYTNDIEDKVKKSNAKNDYSIWDSMREERDKNLKDKNSKISYPLRLRNYMCSPKSLYYRNREAEKTYKTFWKP